MTENTKKHLQLIQAVVTRLAQNSFSMKGWAVTLVVGILALAAKECDWWYLPIALIPSLIFWGLDAYYLRQERLFRKLYDAIRKMPQDVFDSDPFTMDTSPYKNQIESWWATCWSKTVRWLYGPIVSLVLILSSLKFFLCSNCIH